MSNYRPISLLPLFSEVFEKAVYDSLYNYVINIISGSQHGFLNLLTTRNKLILFAWTSVKPLIQCATHC